MKDLRKLVKDKIAEVGVAEAAKLFGVSVGTVSNWANNKSQPSLAAAQLLLDENQSQLVDDMAPALRPIDYIPHLHVANWEGKSVMILLPSYKSINPITHFTLFANYAGFGADKLALGTKNLTVIHEARNFLIHIGMQNPAIQDFIMFDDDMVLPDGSEAHFNGNFKMGVKPESAKFNAIARLMSHPREVGVIGALYYGRHEFGMPQCDWGFNQNRGTLANELRAEQHQGLKVMDWVATGGLRIPRWVIEKKKVEIDAGRWPELVPQPGGWYGYFHPMKAGFGEDMSFGYRLKEIGIKSCLDASLVLGHAEGNVVYGPKNTKNKTR
jgi:transcriptional regulator with XRE-family HTH domain